MSFWKKLFGSGGDDPTVGTGAGAPEEQYKGYTIRASLLPAGREYQLSGTIEKEVGGVVKRHDFVRADRFASKEDAHNFTLAKGRQIIDEQGDALFNQGWPAPPNPSN
ncbi:HlyU family transcriptional regulator [Devosia sp.]|uniref:HlyU family transcriptional regulator n=1 Tax=Devosia sp. TaxID=1871048 RepID=UPI002EEB3428